MKMRAMFFNLGLMLISSIALIAAEAALATEKATPIELGETYINNDTGYSISYPKDWQKKEVPRLDLTLIAPKEPHAEMHASMNVISEKVGPTVTLDEFYKESLKQLQSELKDVHVEKSGDRMFDKTPGKWTVYTHTMGEIKLRVAQYFTIANDIIYLITFSSIDKDYDDYEAEFEAIINSFKLAPSEATENKEVIHQNPFNNKAGIH
jgi:hypothetical protein